METEGEERKGIGTGPLWSFFSSSSCILLASLALMTSARLACSDNRTLDDCDALVRAHPEDIDSYRCYENVGRRTSRQNDVRRRLTAILERTPSNHAARLILAGVELEMGETASGANYRLAADGFRGEGNLEGFVLAKAGLSHFHRLRGELSESRAALDEADAAAQQSGDQMLQAAVWIERGNGANAESLYGQAWTFFKKAESAVFPSGSVGMQISVLEGLANATFSIGRARESFDYFMQTVELYRADEDRWNEAYAFYSVALMGWQLYFAGEMTYDEANDLELKALDCAIQSKNIGAEAYVRCLRAQDPSKTPAEAVEESRRALALSRRMGDMGSICFALRVLADNQLRLHPEDPDAAFLICDEATEMARKAGDLRGIAWGLEKKMYMRIFMHDQANFLADATKALEAIERIRNLQRDDMVKAGFISEWAHDYYSACGYLLDSPGGAPSPEAVQQAFSVIERLRARILLDSLDASHATVGLVPSGRLQERRQSVLNSIARIQQELLGGGHAGAEVERRLEEIERLEESEAALRDEIASHNPGYSALRRPSLASVEDVQKNMRDGEALLSYQLSDRTDDLGSYLGGSWLIAITREDVRLYSLAEKREVEPAVQLFTEMIERRDGTERAGAARLYHDLLRAALDDLPSGTTHLIIVPDQVLHQLPFDALRRESNSEPVGRSFEITIAPSATIWMRWRTEPPPAAHSAALVFADPELRAPGVKVKAGSSSERQWALVSGVSPGPLPYARSEGRELVRRLGGQSLLLAGSEASEHALKTMNLARYRLLHFATHAILDDEHPDRSAILLAPGTPNEDGLLQIREIVQLPLRGKVVVLASCRSASGLLVTGEGVMGLARGFLQAGAQAVIGSLWPLRDEDAEEFFEAFYRHVGAGESLAAALAAARRDRIGEGAPPAAWAGLVLIGDGNIVPMPGGRKGVDPRDLLILLAVAGFVSAAATFARLRQREPR